ncbi:hypothetical protein [Microcoleus sp.]|uniref:hypothetical protein n=1 Tax=Microcoleus sp. TaxID=44472 RepID=UPI00359362F4
MRSRQTPCAPSSSSHLSIARLALIAVAAIDNWWCGFDHNLPQTDCYPESSATPDLIDSYQDRIGAACRLPYTAFEPNMSSFLTSL